MPEVEFPANGSTAKGYLAEPEEEGPGVVVLQEWWGLDDHIRGVVDRFAAEGFVALAPDLFHGETTDQPDEAQQKTMAMNMDEAVKEMRGAIQHLAQHPKCDGNVGVVGFCLGGGLAAHASAASDDVDATVIFYYVMPHGKPDFSQIGGPVQGHFGTSDEMIPEDDSRALEEEIRSAGNDVEFHYYEGAGHAFFADHDRLGTYDAEKSQSAWQRTIDFFKRHLSRS